MEYEIKIDELVKRLSAKLRLLMDETYSDTLIGYGWQIPEKDFLNDVINYVGDHFSDDQILKKEFIEAEITYSINALDEFMRDLYVSQYENNDGDEITSSLREAMKRLKIDGLKSDWILEDINKNWNFSNSQEIKINGSEDWHISYEEYLEIIFNDWDEPGE